MHRGVLSDRVSSHWAPDVQVITIFGIPYSEDYYYKWGSILTIVFTALPWCPFAKAIQDLGQATRPSSDDQGISWAGRGSYCDVRTVCQACAHGASQFATQNNR